MATENRLEVQPENYSIKVLLEEMVGQPTYTLAYKLRLTKQFVQRIAAYSKSHSYLKHVDRFVEKLKKNCQSLPALSFNKWEIYTVNYGMNIGSEINGSHRPSIVYKSLNSTSDKDIIVIPLTSSGENKSLDAFDIGIMANEDTNIAHNSYARLRQLRCISAKRIGKYI